ncbi:glycolipid transfer protein domain-containing protein [Pisolithus thermaeus]|nr:glycolipid transfer protein domain-containing protein [Pisolithus thermaeus]
MESKPYFETVKSFADVPITEDGVETHSFLEASDGLVKLFDLLGSGVFAFVQADIRGNIGVGVRSRYQNASASSITLENLVRSETSTEQHPHATGCLVRLTRGLMFLCKALQHMQNEPSSELHVCFKHSYDEVLRRHHSFVVRSLAAVAVRAVPYRRDFIARISQGGDREKFDSELRRWLAGLDVIVKRLKVFIEEGGYGRV